MNRKIVILALKTFLQSAVGYFTAANVTDNTQLRIVLTGAFACGMSALMNVDWEKMIDEKDGKEEE